MALIDRDALNAAEPRELLVAYESILGELRSRNVVRTHDAPLGQWAEWLARERLGGTLERNSRKGHDLVTPDERRIEVKSRMVRDVKRRSERQLSPFRSFDFHDCLVLLFSPDYTVRSATRLPVDLVRAHAHRRDHVNGSILFATDELLSLGQDETPRFK